MPTPRLARAAFWLATSVVLVLTLLPTQYLPAAGPFNFWDKAQHALAFAVLAVLGRFGWPNPKQQPRLVLGLLVLGGGIELAQHLTGWRHGEWADWGADALGVLIVAAASWLAGRNAPG